MKGFSYIEHRENVALALDICEHIGVKRAIALKGMYKAQPDEGALKAFKIRVFGKDITFYNAFAANDPDFTAHEVVFDQRVGGRVQEHRSHAQVGELR